MGPALSCANAGISLLTAANIGIKSGFLQGMWEKNVIFVESYHRVGVIRIDIQR